MTPRGKHDHPWIQPIVVARNGHHEPTVALAARASAAVYTKGSPRFADDFAAWLSGPFGKTVRRATYAEMLKVIRWAAANDVDWVDLDDADSAALALPPMRYEDLPREIARLQVSGTNFSRIDEASRVKHSRVAHSRQDPPVVVRVDSSLTTGKASAQAAHALWMWMLSLRVEDRQAWTKDDLPARFEFVTADDLGSLAGDSSAQRFAVRDAGLTEVEPGTLTAVSSAH